MMLALSAGAGRAAVIAVDGTTCNLGNAILSANSDSALGGCSAGAGADTLVLGADVTLVTPATPVVEGSPSGLPAITSNMTIAAAAGTVIERSLAIGCSQIGISPFRLLEVSAGGNLTLTGLTMRNGCVFPAVAALQASGGAILVQGGTLKIESCRLENNRTIGGLDVQTGLARGGAVAVLGGSLEIVDSTFVGNGVWGTDSHGGAVAVESGQIVAVMASEFIGNHAGPYPATGLGSPAYGGAISLRDTVAGTLAHLRIFGNTVGFEPFATFFGPATGGGLAVEGGRVGELRDSLFAANIAQAGSDEVGFQPLPGRGGGLANSGTIDAILRTTFADNQALGYEMGEGRGGGLDNRGRIGRIVSSTFVGNVAKGGVGLHALGGNGYGGGVANVGEIGLVEASTLAGNRALQSIWSAFAMGGGIYNATDDETPDTGMVLQNNLLAANEAVDGSDCWSAGSQASLGWNLVLAPDPSCSFASAGDIVGEDPMDLALADNGCTVPLPDGSCVPTVALPPTSPAVDAGLCTASGTEIDARGAVRPVDIAGVPDAPGSDGCDIGAFERDGTLAAVHLGLSVADSADPVVSGWSAGNLVYTVALASLGSAPATGIAVTIAPPLPAGVTLDAVTTSTGSWDGSTWTVPSLASGAHATAAFVLTAGFGTAGGSEVLSLTSAVTAATPHSGEFASDVETTSVIEGVFFDGFESDDTLAWSLTVGDS